MTSSQVAKGIKDQQPFIQKTVEDQARDAVKALQPTISSSVEKATADQIGKAVIPIENQMKVYADFIRMGNLATLARSDDRAAFEYLLQVALGKKPESASTELRKLAETTAAAIIAEKQWGLNLSVQFKEKQTPDAIKKFLSSANAQERQAALDNYPPEDRSILPILVRIIKDDPNLTVVYKAVLRFDGLTKQTFEFWRTNEIIDWWEKNQKTLQ